MLAAMRKVRVPLDTATEDIHTVYKSPRPLMTTSETSLETFSVSFLCRINMLVTRYGHYGAWKGYCVRSWQNKKATTFASATGAIGLKRLCLRRSRQESVN